MIPELSDDPNISILPFEFAVCAIMVVVAMLVIWIKTRRLVLVLLSGACLPSCSMELEPTFTITDKDGNAISLTVKAINIEKDSGK